MIQNIHPFLIRHKFIVVLLMFAVVGILVSCFYIGYRPNLKKDALEYFEAARFLQGTPVNDQIQLGRVISAPLFLYTSIFINYFVNDFSTSFAVLNVLFYFVCIVAFYFLALEIYKEKKIAFLSTVLVVFNYYMIDPSNAHLADMSSWFFYTLATFLAVRYVNTFNKKFYYLSILFTAIGVLFKEYGGLALLNLSLLVCVSNMSWKQKLKDILIAGVLVLAPLLSFHAFIYLKYHYLYFERFVKVAVDSVVPGFEQKGLKLLIKVLGWLFSFGWLAFCFGLKKEFEARDKNRIKILAAILPATLTFYIWPAIDQRLAVLFMMWLLLIAGFGLSKVKWYWPYAFLVGYILFNFNIKYLLDIINLPF